MFHYPIAWAFQAFVSFVAPVSAEVKNVSKVSYSDVANQYVSLKYSNDYLRFWDNVSGNVALRTRKIHDIISDPKAFKFFNNSKKKEGSDTWRSLVTFCKNMRGKIENREDLNNGQLRYIGFCDEGDSISWSQDINTRSYWVDKLVRVKYKAEDFNFWDKLVDNIDERTHKFYDLMQRGYIGGLQEVLGKAKTECQGIRNKFASKEKFTQEDLDTNIPRCLSSLRTR
ncbi:hypothetical protein MHC_05165 [Mycoplasma haemocanis str. Illinois]|uniref:Uncharacterized protein n=1 Tax=Mycoplasma haemocanis (strain Illinois) TaxID=1111676 RepID=H6N8B5_MYCHN|nr:hypothetical protein [Mycoplasma haemocanis]AEW45887.1 hypothetical protein MHC_05165 [Mycoplasma haemocanis str. Illinois]